jgi:hypothetical protein
MTEMARLIEMHNIKPAQVVKVEVGANHAMLQALLHHQPQTGLEAKFSMEFCMAILLGVFRLPGACEAHVTYRVPCPRLNRHRSSLQTSRPGMPFRCCNLRDGSRNGHSRIYNSNLGGALNASRP